MLLNRFGCQLVFCLSLLFYSFNAFTLDVYQSYAELKADPNLQEGRDYEIRIMDKGSNITVLAIHGGGIESGTSEIATQIAGDTSNLYTFNGLMASGNERLHITSTRFDEPLGTALVQKSDLCISVHGYDEMEKPCVCVGGLNGDLKKVIVATLQQKFLFQTKVCENALAGLSPKNIVNKAKKNGLQLELSIPLRDLFEKNPRLASQFSQTIRETVQNFLQGQAPPQ